MVGFKNSAKILAGESGGRECHLPQQDAAARDSSERKGIVCFGGLEPDVYNWQEEAVIGVSVSKYVPWTLSLRDLLSSGGYIILVKIRFKDKLYFKLNTFSLLYSSIQSK